MTELQIFNFDGSQVRTFLINEEPYFVGKDVAQILGYQNLSKAIKDHVDDEDKLNNVSLSSLGQRGGWLINESGVYSLVFGSKLEKAKEFKRWVTNEVLPSIRKHGMYATPQTAEKILEDPDFLIKALQDLKQEREKRKALETENKTMQPKALFADAVATSKTSILIGDLAKILKQNGVNIGQKRLFEWLRNHGYLVKRNGADRNMPTQKSMDMGLFEIKETVVTHADGHVTISKTTKVTGKGQQYFINKFLANEARG